MKYADSSLLTNAASLEPISGTGVGVGPGAVPSEPEVNLLPVLHGGSWMLPLTVVVAADAVAVGSIAIIAVAVGSGLVTAGLGVDTDALELHATNSRVARTGPTANETRRSPIGEKRPEMAARCL